MEFESRPLFTRFCRLFFLLLICWEIGAVNIDEEPLFVLKGPKDSLFGLSVAAHREKGKNWVIVGAPSGESRVNRPGVKTPGSVYRCRVTHPHDCQEIPFDITGNNNSSGEAIDEKSDQWFGATVHSSGENGFIVACAPRYVYFSVNRKRREPVGTCFTSSENFSKFSEYSPCRTNNFGHHQHGYCQAGFSVAVANNRLIIGAVGSRYWQGQAFSQNLGNRLDIRSSSEGTISDDDSYLGYSVSVGKFGAREEREDIAGKYRRNNYDPFYYTSGSTRYRSSSTSYRHQRQGQKHTSRRFPSDGQDDLDLVVGIPRGGNLAGNVTILRGDTLEHLTSFIGEQIGSYFGHSVAVGDFNGDGEDDVAIGAPLYSLKGQRETGRVYVIYQKRKQFRKWDIFSGPSAGGRYGLSVANCGDLNGDGVDDLCVGAPFSQSSTSDDDEYEDSEPSNWRSKSLRNKKGGMIDVYYGSANGLKETFRQRIYGESSRFKGFGYSLSGGVDIDGNGLPDIVVGSPFNDAVAVLRAKSVVNVVAEIKVEKMSFADASMMTSYSPYSVCGSYDGQDCFKLVSCLTYTGMHLEDELDFEIDLYLDSKKMGLGRLTFTDKEYGGSQHNGGFDTMKTVTLKGFKGKSKCVNQTLKINDQIRDVLSPIEVEQKIRLRDSAILRTHSLYIEDNSKMTAYTYLERSCGSDDICHPDFKMNAVLLPPKYIIGSGEKLTLSLTLSNFGETAFDSYIEVAYPSDKVSFVKSSSKDNGQQNRNFNEVSSVFCSPKKEKNDSASVDEDRNSTSSILNCALGKHLKANITMDIDLSFEYLDDTKISTSNDEKVEFSVKSGSFDMTKNDLVQHEIKMVQTQISRESQLKVRGVSIPDMLYFNVTADNSTDVIHLYQVENFGPSSVGEFQVKISWPTFDSRGRRILKLRRLPTVNGKGTCSKISFSNLATSLDELNDFCRDLSQCEVIDCFIGPLSAKESVVIKIEANVNPGFDEEEDIFSDTIVVTQNYILREITSMLQIINFGANFKGDHRRAVTTTVRYVSDLRSRPVPLWLILLSVFSGVLLLLLISLVLHKCGFFERRRMPPTLGNPPAESLVDNHHPVPAGLRPPGYRASIVGRPLLNGDIPNNSGSGGRQSQNNLNNAEYLRHFLKPGDEFL